MNKTTLLLLLILTWILTACSGTAARSSGQGFNGGTGPGNGTAPAAGSLSMPMQVAIGILKLDGTKNAVTADQATELLPLWETLQALYASDTAATQEKDALVTQIQETMTKTQIQAITALNLSRQDMFSIMQSQTQTFGGTQNSGTTRSSGTSGNNGRNFGGGGGFAGGPPPDGGGFPGGGFQGERTQSGSSSAGGTSNSTTRSATATDPNRIPTPLIQAVIDYLKTKSGSK